ncbi:hypothetical protein N9Y42_04125 [Mariniblastus sp.]|nr:hypothetical protein [Mariniblastus sp.]
MLTRLADRLVLKPSTHPIESETSCRKTIPLFGGELEYYADHVTASKEGPATGKLLLVKFPGTGGRAERATTHPAECWGGDTVTWTINPPGYGSSTGPATLQRYPEMVRSIGRHASEEIGIKTLFCDIARKELRLRKKQLDLIDETRDELIAAAQAKQSETND